MDNYEDFLRQKTIRFSSTGIKEYKNNDILFSWQNAVTEWAINKGKAALFEDCGLGKTGQQLVWAEQVARYTNKPVIILAPLAVSLQTQREAVKFGVEAKITESQSDVIKGVNITNYEKLKHFDTSKFGGVVLDESSILKSYMGKTKRFIVDSFKDTPYKLACTATPAPNDLMELLNHAEFLGIMRSSEALSVWFIADQTQSGTYKLKGHAAKDFWQWVSSWSVCISSPSDIGYSDKGYILPKLTEINEVIKVSELNDDITLGFFRDIDMSATGFYKERRRTTKERAARCAEIAKSKNGQSVIWCGTNEESAELKKLLPEAREVKGNDNAEWKETAAVDFIDGKYKVLISKASIFGYGLNFQNCSTCIFCGLDYSYESYYQAVRRFYRFGQLKPVDVYRVIGTTERSILDTINRKHEQKANMEQSMSEHMREFQKNELKGHSFRLEFNQVKRSVPEWLRSEAS